MIKILANDGIEADGQLLLEDAGFEVITQKVDQADLPMKLPDYDAILVRSATKVRQELMDACPKLKLIGRGGVGLDNIDVEYAESKGIKVINTPAASSRSVSELAFAHMLSLARFLHQSNREMPVRGSTDFKKLKSNYGAGMELQGKTLGVLGFGRIGQETARIGLAMGMKVLPADLYVDEAVINIQLFEMEQASVSVKLKTVSLETMLAKSDFISVHIPFSGDKPLLGKEEITQMKDGVILINTARGGIIGEDALLEALNNGKVRAAALDVFNDEPSPNPALLRHPNISLSPHIGAATGEAQSNIGKELADQIIAYFDK